MSLLDTKLTVPHLCHREEAYRQLISKHKQQWLNKYRRKIIWRRRTKKTKQGFWRLLPAISVTVGSVLLANALWPVLSYFAFTSPDLQRQELVSARPKFAMVAQSSSIAKAIDSNQLNPKIIKQELDYTDLNSWFPETGLPEVDNSAQLWEKQVDEYILNIPKLDVEQAIVKVGGTNLDEHLIQYQGTSEPGKFGAPVIFGHSVLRQFYNPSIKNSRRYFSIFSKIMTLQNGDKIELEYDGIKYTYAVIDKVEVKPDDMYILEQNYDRRYLKLITCVPEGTYLRRGVVVAQLEESN